MSITASGFLILVKILLYTSCAPKIGPLLLDPLIFESQNSIKTDTKAGDTNLIPVLRSKQSDEKIKVSDETKPCCGYDYDVTQCKYVNDRRICGYNKNRGDVKSEEAIDAGNGCQIRNGRIECGYKTGPFNITLRRPSETEEANEELARRTIKTSNTTENNRTTDIITTGAADEDDIEVIVKVVTTTAKESSIELNKRKNAQPIKYCVEKMDRILCYSVTNKDK